MKLRRIEGSGNYLRVALEPEELLALDNIGENDDYGIFNTLRRADNATDIDDKGHITIRPLTMGGEVVVRMQERLRNRTGRVNISPLYEKAKH